MTERSGRRPGGRSLARAPRALLPAVPAALLAIALFAASGAASGIPDRGRVSLARGRSGSGDSWTATSVQFDVTDGAATALPRRPLSTLTSRQAGDAGATTRLVAIPNCRRVEIASVTLRTADGSIALPARNIPGLARVRDLGLLRDQRLAALEINLGAAAVASAGELRGLDLSLACEGAEGPAVRATGPLTGACRAAIVNYDAADAWTPQPRERSRVSGTVSYCSTVGECAAAQIDMLIIAAEDLYAAPTLMALANHHAATLGLNVGIVCACSLSELSSDGIYEFIDGVYGSASAEHFGDGHLGFVLLVGDAYADDNQTPMLPSYYGYGGQEEASDHYYACLSGDDDIEDVIIGRLSVGNLDELVSTVSKTLGYVPFASWEEWTRRVLMIGGLFYTIKEDYVALFDSYDAIVPDEYTVDRIYRHDFATDQACALSVVDAMNAGSFIVNFAGDGWISLWDHVLNTGHIDLMTNAGRLPIVLSMACDTGRFDNTSEPDASGSYDCLAEQLVNVEANGAVACLAAPRASDGGMFKTFTKDIYRAVFEEHSVFLGEAIAVAKLMHLGDGGDPAYPRHFNLFGDPALIFTWDSVPPSLPDLTLQPHRIVWQPEYPGTGDDLLVTIPVTNQSPILADNVLIRLSGHNAAGPYIRYGGIDEIDGWSTGTVTIAIPHLGAGENLYEVTIDPYNVIAEIDETNNYTARTLYVYPLAPDFPVDLDRGLLSPTVARLGDSMRILTIDDEGRTLCLLPDGTQEWASDALSEPPDLGPEIAPTVGDIDGDGEAEIVSTKQMGVVAFSASGEELWRTITDNPIGSTVLADADADADLDIIVATKPFFGNTCQILALDESGNEIWSFAPPAGSVVTAAPAVGDLDIDGRAEIVLGTSDGRVFAFSTADDPPAELWPAVQVGASGIDAVLLADLDDAGALEIIVAGEDLFVLDGADGSESWSVALDGDVVSLAVGDTDADRLPEIVAGTDAPSLHLLEDGGSLWSYPLTGVPGTSAAIADIDADDHQEIIVGTDAGRVHLVRDDGTDLLPPAPVGGGCLTPSIADLNGDGGPEVVVTTLDGLVFALSMDCVDASASVCWSGLGGGPDHTGRYAQPLHGEITADCLLAGTSIVTGDLSVAEGVTLTIAPAASVVFRPQANPRLSVSGEVVCIADSLRPIVFGTGAARGDWQGIEITPGGGATLRSCEISNASLAISGTGASITLEDCRLVSNTVGLCLEECTLVATGCLVMNSGGVGMLLEGGTSTVTDCVFDQNVSAGAECRDNASGTITDCVFSNSTYGDGIRFYRHSNMSVRSSTVTGNCLSGVFVNNAAPTFDDCAFTDNVGDGIYCRRSAAPTILSSVISGNRFGILTEGKSTPCLGNGFPGTGNNSVTGNWCGAIMSLSGEATTILAMNNWWGSSPPPSGLFRGNIVYEPWLDGPPAPERPTDVPEEGVLPAVFALAQNSPNPFNPTTTIRYEVPAPGADVEIAVYSSAGRLVTLLRSGSASAGEHHVTWDGRDSRGREVASGIYFARMTAGDFVTSKKMVLLK